MSRKKYPDLPDDAIIGLKVEIEPKFSVGELAVKLAEALQKSVDLKEDARTFSEQANFERQKSKKLKEILFVLKERERNPPEKISRMDPYSSYNKKDIESEIQLANSRSREFDQTTSKFRLEASKLEIEIVRLQGEIKRLNQHKG